MQAMSEKIEVLDTLLNEGDVPHLCCDRLNGVFEDIHGRLTSNH
jgi:hypothetical protein